MCRSVDTMEADNFIYFCRLTTVYCQVWYCGTVVLCYCGAVVLWYCGTMVKHALT